MAKITLNEDGEILEQLYSTKQVSLCQCPRVPSLGSMAKIEHAVWANRQVRRELVSAIQNLLRTGWHGNLRSGWLYARIDRYMNRACGSKQQLHFMKKCLWQT